MIGGADLVLQGPTKSQDADLLLRTIRARWPNARVQTADSSGAAPLSQLHFPILGPAEYIVYRDQESFEAWSTVGATPKNQSTVLHILISSDEVTIVVDEENSPLAAMAWEMLKSLQRNRIAIRNNKVAA